MKDVKKKKVKRKDVELIVDARARKHSYTKRKVNLMKRAYEFSTLCDVDTCVIIADPRNNVNQTEPATWPEDRERLRNIVQRYRNVPTEERQKRAIHLADPSDKGKAKVGEDETFSKETNKDENNKLLKAKEYQEAGAKLDSKLEAVFKRIELFKSNPNLMKKAPAARGIVIEPQPEKMEMKVKENMLENMKGKGKMKMKIKTKEKMKMIDYNIPIYYPGDHVGQSSVQGPEVEMEKEVLEMKSKGVIEMEKAVVETKSKSDLDPQQENMKMMAMENLKEKMIDQNTNPNYIHGGHVRQPSVQSQDSEMENATPDTKLKGVIEMEKAVAELKSVSVLDPHMENMKMMTMKNQYSTSLQPTLQLSQFDRLCCPPKETKWTAPPENWVKINIGGAIFNGMGSSVCIARNHFGMVLGCWTTLSTKIPSEVMESKALSLGITSALSNKWEKIIFEGDMEWIISAVTNPGSSSESQPSHLVEEAKVFLQQHRFWKVTYSHWTTNEAAFELAHWALESGFSGALQPHELPRQVSQVVARELAYCSSAQNL